MELFYRSRPPAEHPAGFSDRPYRLCLFAGAFNPPTVAHLALARAAMQRVYEVLFVLPRAFPHKGYDGADLNTRVEMLHAAVAKERGFSIAVSESGLFRAIARECREIYGPEVKLSFLCGRDAAERILEWDYGSETTPVEMLREFDLLVAGRRGHLEPPLHVKHAIERLDLPGDFDLISSTEVRHRIARGEPWEHLVPEEVRALAAKVYGPGPA